MSYLAIVRWDVNGKLEKYQPFANEKDAHEHVKKYGGFVVANPGGNMDFWVIDPINKRIIVDNMAELITVKKHRLEMSLAKLKQSVTSKLMREAILDLMHGNVTAKSKLMIKHEKIHKKNKQIKIITNLLERMKIEELKGRSDTNYIIKYNGKLYNIWGFDSEKNKNHYVITQQNESETYTDAFNMIIKANDISIDV
jgi:YHS domain-containing protein